jgi:hypothetical protein
MLPCPHCGHPLILSPADVPAPAAPADPGELQQREDRLLTYLDTVRRTDATAAAAHLYDTDHPARVLVERCRRMLDRLARDGVLVKRAGRAGGPRGGHVSIYTVAG